MAQNYSEIFFFFIKYKPVLLGLNNNVYDTFYLFYVLFETLLRGTLAIPYMICTISSSNSTKLKKLIPCTLK
jgi:hypothetical protein